MCLIDKLRSEVLDKNDVLWYDAQEEIVKAYDTYRSPSRGFALARRSSHIDAKWLLSIISEEVTAGSDAKRLISKRGNEQDGRTLFFLGAITPFNDRLILLAAEAGYSTAHGEMARWSSDFTKKFFWALRGAMIGDRSSMRCLADCLLWGRGGVEKDEKLSLEFRIEAARRGDGCACYELAEDHFCKDDIVTQYFWKIQAAKHDIEFLAITLHKLKKVNKRGVLFIVGQTLFGNVTKVTVFGYRGLENGLVERAENLVEFYSRRCDESRTECVMWVMIGRRLGVNKDVRKIIARKLWEGRKTW